MNAQHRSSTIATLQHARQIVLPRLSHHAQTARNQGKSNIFRHELEPLPSLGKHAQRISEHLTVCGSGKCGFVQTQPRRIVVLRRSLTKQRDPFEEITDTKHAITAKLALRTRRKWRLRCGKSVGISRTMPCKMRLALLVNSEIATQRIVISLQLFANRIIILIGKPQAETRREIMIARQLIVETKTFRTITDQTCGNPPLICRICAGNQRFAEIIPECARQSKSRNMVRNRRNRICAGFCHTVRFARLLRFA